MHLGRSMARLFVHVYYFLRFFKVLSTRTRVVGGATSVAVSPCAFRSSGSAPSSSNVSTAVARLNRHARCNKVIPDESFPLTSTRPDRRMASSAAASSPATANQLTGAPWCKYVSSGMKCRGVCQPELEKSIEKWSVGVPRAGETSSRCEVTQPGSEGRLRRFHGDAPGLGLEG